MPGVSEERLKIKYKYCHLHQAIISIWIWHQDRMDLLILGLSL